MIYIIIAALLIFSGCNLNNESAQDQSNDSVAGFDNSSQEHSSQTEERKEEKTEQKKDKIVETSKNEDVANDTVKKSNKDNKQNNIVEKENNQKKKTNENKETDKKETLKKEDKKVSKLTISQTSASIEEGRYLNLSCNKKVTWSVSNSNARVNGRGRVTALNVGSCVVTAKAKDGTKATCKITIKKCTHHSCKSNIGKYFKTKNECERYFDQKIKYWGDRWENDLITDKEYYQNCPSRWEAEYCSFCGIWALSFYYNE